MVLVAHAAPRSPLSHPPHPTPQMEDMEAELVSKMAQVKVLVAENEMLQARERVLQTFVAGGAAMMEQLEATHREEEARAEMGRQAVELAVDLATGGAATSHTPATSAAAPSSALPLPLAAAAAQSSLGDGPTSGAAGAAAPTSSVASGSSSAGGRTASSSSQIPCTPGSSGPIAAMCLSGAAAAAAEADASHARIHTFCDRFCAYRAHLVQHRVKRDGSVKVAPAGDPSRDEALSLIDTVMTMPYDDSYQLMAMNAETKQVEAHPADLCSRVARKLKMT